jgi:uncharacterized membrane protein
MDNTLHLTIGVYQTSDDAKDILNTLQSMEKQGTLKITDAAMMTKSEDGKLHVQETEDLTARKGAKRGALIMGAVGLVFPPSLIASAILGGGIGALIGKFRDSGVKKDQMERVAYKLKPGMAAVCVLASADAQDTVDATLKAHDGEITMYDMGPDTSEDIASAALQSTGVPYQENQ